jgi:hypothetical protein
MKYLIQLRDTVCPVSWNGIPELAIDHYLWLDNGYAPTVNAKLMYTSECIHLHYNIYEVNPTVLYYSMNEPVFKDSCVEFFFQPLPESDPRYLNFEMNAAGTLLLKLGSDRNDRTYLQNVDPALFLIHTSTGCYDSIADMTYWQLDISIPFDWIQIRISVLRSAARFAPISTNVGMKRLFHTTDAGIESLHPCLISIGAVISVGWSLVNLLKA